MSFLSEVKAEAEKIGSGIEADWKKIVGGLVAEIDKLKTELEFHKSQPRELAHTPAVPKPSIQNPPAVATDSDPKKI